MKKIALFGAVSTSKTLQIRSLIEDLGVGNVGIINAEEGLSVIESSLVPEHVRVVSKLSEFEKALEEFAPAYRGDGQFLWIDGGTRILKWNAGKIWDATDDAYESMVFRGMRRNELKGLSQYGSRFISGAGEIDGYKQWQEIGTQADILFNKILRAGCNLYMNFWEDLTPKGGGDRGRDKPYAVDAPGKASRDAVMGFFDFILRLTYEDGVPVATHDRTGMLARTKSRDDWTQYKVPGSIKPFRLNEFLRLIQTKPAIEPTKLEVVK